MFVRLADVMARRDLDVLDLFAERRTNAEIAAWLVRSQKAKLEVDMPAGAVVKTVLLDLLQ